MPELFYGFVRSPGEGQTLYPVACAPQAWAAGAVFLLMQAALGLEVRALENKIIFSHPLMPAFLKEVHMTNLKVGAESIDLLDILFRVERSTGVKIQASDLGEYMQGGLPDDKFSDDNEAITPEGMEHLKKVMPQIDADALQGQLKAEDVIKHFTVANLATMVAERQGGGG